MVFSHLPELWVQTESKDCHIHLLHLSSPISKMKTQASHSSFIIYLHDNFGNLSSSNWVSPRFCSFSLLQTKAFWFWHRCFIKKRKPLQNQLSFCEKSATSREIDNWMNNVTTAGRLTNVTLGPTAELQWLQLEIVNACNVVQVLFFFGLHDTLQNLQI